MPSETVHFDRLGMEFIDGGGEPLAPLEVVIRLDVVEFFLLDRSKAAFLRYSLKEWLLAPQGEYEQDDLLWFVADGRMCVTVDRESSFVVSDMFISDLVRAL